MKDTYENTKKLISVPEALIPQFSDLSIYQFINYKSPIYPCS